MTISALGIHGGRRAINTWPHWEITERFFVTNSITIQNWHQAQHRWLRSAATEYRTFSHPPSITYPNINLPKNATCNTPKNSLQNDVDRCMINSVLDIHSSMTEMFSRCFKHWKQASTTLNIRIVPRQSIKLSRNSHRSPTLSTSY